MTNLEIIKSLPSLYPLQDFEEEAIISLKENTSEWEKGYTFPDGEYYKCKKCQKLIKVKYPMNFCNNCGADMRGEAYDEI